MHLGRDAEKNKRHFDRANEFNTLGGMKSKPEGIDSPNSSANMSDVSDNEQEVVKEKDHVPDILEVLR